MPAQINTENESTLHAQLKDWYAEDGDKLECEVDSYIIDLVRDDLLIEIQTANFSSIKPKINNLVKDHSLRLVYPIPTQKWLVYVNKKGKQIRRRKSPKRGDFTDLFHEMIHAPLPFNNPKFSLEILYIDKEEVRCEDGKGSWRRGGVSIVDHRLLEVGERVLLEKPADIHSLFPSPLPEEFTNKDLAQLWDISIYRVRMITYVLRQMNVIEHVGKRGREYLFKRV